MEREMKFSVCVALICAVMSVGTPAQAVTYDWSFSSGIGSGSGTFNTATPVGPAQIVGISGTWNGNTISSLLAPGGFLSNDNTLLALTPSIALDFGGFSFAANGLDVNIFFCTSANSRPCSAVGDYWFQDRNDVLSVGAFNVVPALTATPVPAALPLFLSGLGFLGWI